MRLMQSRLKTVPLFRPDEVQSSYIGTETVYNPIGEITAEIQPLSSVLTREQYGDKISRGIALFCETGTDIRERDRVCCGDCRYTVTGVIAYGNIIRADAERTNNE